MTLYRHGRVQVEVPFAVVALSRFCRFAWWLVRGIVYGIGLCLQGQLRVPVEGWRIIGRSVRKPLPLIGYFALTLVCVFVVLFSLMQILFILF